MAQVASDPTLAAAVRAGLRLHTAWSAEPHFDKPARIVPSDTEVVYSCGGGLAADAAKYVPGDGRLPPLQPPCRVFPAMAPRHLRTAGVCDFRSITTALRDRHYAEERGTNPPDQRYTP